MKKYLTSKVVPTWAVLTVCFMLLVNIIVLAVKTFS